MNEICANCGSDDGTNLKEFDSDKSYFWSELSEMTDVCVSCGDDFHPEEQNITRVYFRKYTEGDVIAIFPDIQADLQRNVLSYQHIGQRGSCIPEHIDILQVASESEYESLKMELESIGYNLEIL